MMIYTGFRITAFLELTRFDYDRSSNILKGGIKTEAGKGRMIPVHPVIKPYLEYFLSLGGEKIITTEDGMGYTINNFRKRYYYPTPESLGIRRLSPHTCRHTFVTMLTKAGAKTTTIQKLAGHADYSTTANVYTHADIGSLTTAINKM